jgi:hypothetical protein
MNDRVCQHFAPTMHGVVSHRILEVLQENNNSVDFDVAGYAASLGVPALTCGSTLEEVLTSRWCLPSLTIADIRSATTDDTAKRFGPTRFSVVPYFAQVSSVCFQAVQTLHVCLLIWNMAWLLEVQSARLCCAAAPAEEVLPATAGSSL